MRKKIFCAIIIFFSGFFTEFILSILAKHTQKLLVEKPDQCPYCSFYLDDEEEY